MTSLPRYLLNAWRLQRGDEELAKQADELTGWTLSALAESCMKYHLDRHYESIRKQASISSLTSIAVGQILDLLSASDDLAAEARTLSEDLDPTLLRRILDDQRTPYQVLRAINDLPPSGITEGRSIVDVDEALIRNEHYIRSRGHANQDGKYLVSLQDFCDVVSGEHKGSKPTQGAQSTDWRPLKFQRLNPPKGGLEVLNYWRSEIVSINRNNRTFVEVFNRLTKHILRGLNWTNVMVAGGMVLTTLLHTHPGMDHISSVENPDIDLYIYGLSAEDANRKVAEIYDAWARNLSPAANKRLVIKNAKTINLLTHHPNRRIQIVLKLLPTPTDVLLNFDLDACAMGYDGRHVFMLPRCARALETGYSVFTMDLIWGHHLGDRRASQEIRIFKYADRGFGIRFLPSYARSLEEEGLEKSCSIMTEKPDQCKKASENHQSHVSYQWSQRERKPFGGEPGLKTLKRIAYLGQDYVQRFYFGVTPLVISPRQMGWPTESPDEAPSVQAENATDEETVGRKLFQETWKEKKPIIRFADLDTGGMHFGLPDGRKGLGNLEIFMRHCEAWRLDACGKAELDMDVTASLAYDAETYDDFPIYQWDANFSVDELAHRLETHNDNIWATTKRAICGKLDIHYRTSGYADYSTRRIRRQVFGPDLKTVQEKQITIPVNVPYALENYLLGLLPQMYDDLPSHFTNFKPLIPVHDSSRYDPSTASLPSLHDTASEKGNLRYWVITNESMWASQHRVLDEFAELMWSLFHWFNRAISTDPFSGERTLEDDSMSCWQLARSLRRRIVLPEVPSDRLLPDNLGGNMPSLREALLFRPWAFVSPVKPNRVYNEEQDERHELFHEEAVLYPFLDELFWHPGDEGMWDEEGAPEWTKIPDEDDEVKESPEVRWDLDGSNELTSFKSASTLL